METSNSAVASTSHDGFVQGQFFDRFFNKGFLHVERTFNGLLQMRKCLYATY